MNNGRLAAAERGLNGVARKVLEAIPAQEAWSRAQVIAELKRLGQNLDVSVLDGCLGALVAAGLVREPTTRTYIRVQAKVRLAMSANADAENDDVPEPPEKAAPGSPMDRLADLAAEVRAMADRVRAMATEIDDIALDVTQRIQRIEGDAERLRQLQQLLKGIV